MRPFFVQVLLAVGLSCWFGFTGQYAIARAEPAPSSAPVAPAGASPTTSYEETIRHAVEEYSLGHWTEARFFFGRAHALNPNARTLRGLGLTCYESRNYVEAIGYFQQALQSAEQPLTDKMRADIQQLKQLAEQFVTRVIVTLEPASAELEVDHSARQLGADNTLLLDPGEHELSASAEGYQSEARTLNAEGGELRVELRLRTQAGAMPAVVSAPARPLAPAPQPSAQSGDLAPYIVMGAGGAALIAGAVLVGIAASDKYAVEHAQPGAAWSQLEPRYNRGRTFFPVGFALMGVGLAGAAAGLTWKLWPADKERAPTAQLRMGPLGFELSGAF